MELVFYGDDSGDSTPEALGACIARVEDWERFSDEWAQLLAGFDLSWFHAADFEASKDQFDGWDEDQKALLCDRIEALTCIQSIGAYVGSVIPKYAQMPKLSYQDKSLKEGREAAWERPWKRMENAPYAVCFSACLARAIRHVALPLRQKMHVVLANQAGEVGNAALVYQSARMMPEF